MPVRASGTDTRTIQFGERRASAAEGRQQRSHSAYSIIIGAKNVYKRQAYCSFTSSWFESSCQRSSSERTLWL